MMRGKENINWGYGFVQTTPNSQNLESKKCMADRAENNCILGGEGGVEV